jgi:hypothetical protein
MIGLIDMEDVRAQILREIVFNGKDRAIKAAQKNGLRFVWWRLKDSDAERHKASDQYLCNAKFEFFIGEHDVDFATYNRIDLSPPVPPITLTLDQLI